MLVFPKKKHTHTHKSEIVVMDIITSHASTYHKVYRFSCLYQILFYLVYFLQGETYFQGKTALDLQFKNTVLFNSQ